MWRFIYAVNPEGRRATSSPPYLTLLRTGFARPAGYPFNPLLGPPVSSYLTISPLPWRRRSVIQHPNAPAVGGTFLLHFPSDRSAPSWLFQASTGILPYEVRTFLPEINRGRHPANSNNILRCSAIYTYSGAQTVARHIDPHRNLVPRKLTVGRSCFDRQWESAQ